MDNNRFPYKHVIWDWNGTLLDDAWLCVETMGGMLESRGLPPVTPERYESLFGFPVIDYYRALGFDFAVDPFESLSDAFIDGYRARTTECPLRDGSRAALEKIARMGIGQSILSAMEQRQLDSLIAHYGLRDYFATVDGLDDHHAHGKTAVGKRWLSTQTIDPAEMIYIGDTVHDHEVAAALGVDCVLIYSGHHARRRLAATGRRVIERLGQVFLSTDFTDKN